MSVIVRSAQNLGETDPASLVGRAPDAYAVVEIAGTRRATGVVRDSSDPVWTGASGRVELGVFESGTPIKVTLFDKDEGFELADDELGSVDTAVIACSMFLATECAERSLLPLGDVPCYLGVPGLNVDDDGALQFYEDAAGSNSSLSVRHPFATCLEVEVRVVPFRVSVERSYVAGAPASVDVAGTFALDAGATTGGAMYLGGPRLQGDYFEFAPARRGLLVRTVAGLRMSQQPLFASVRANMDCDAFVFRFIPDLVDGAPDPVWLSEAWGWGAPEVPVRLLAQGEGLVLSSGYEALRRRFRAGEEVVLGGNRAGVAAGAPEHGRMYVAVLKPVVRALASASDGWRVRAWGRSAVWGSIGEFGVPLALLLVSVLPFLDKVRWRLDLAGAFFATRLLPEEPSAAARRLNDQLGVFSADDRARMHPAAALFVGLGRRPMSVEGRRNLWWVTSAATALVAIPPVLIVVWGIALAVESGHGHVGAAVSTLGLAALLLLAARRQWQAASWRASLPTVAMLGVALLLVPAFCVIAALLEPSLFALSCVFFLLNFLPLVYIVFLSDRRLALAHDVLDAKLRLRASGRPASASAPPSPGPAASPSPGTGTGTGAASAASAESLAAPKGAVAAAMGVDDMKGAEPFLDVAGPKLEAVAREMRARLAGVPWNGQPLGDPSTLRAGEDGGPHATETHAAASGSLRGSSSEEAEEAEGGSGGAGGSGANQGRQAAGQARSVLGKLLGGDVFSVSHELPNGWFAFADPLRGVFVHSSEGAGGAVARAYAASLLVLVLYCVLAFAHGGRYGSQSVGLSVLVVLFDVAAVLAQRSDAVKWSPGTTCLLLSAVRVSLALFSGRLWVAGLALAFLVMGGALAWAVVDARLPAVDAMEAGAVAYVDADEAAAARRAARATRGDVGETPEFALAYLVAVYVLLLLGAAFFSAEASELLGAVPAWVVGVGCLLALVLWLLGFATARAAWLDQAGLLPAWLADVHLWWSWMRPALMFAAGAEVVLLLVGLVAFAALGSAIILVLCVLLPVVGGLWLRAAGQWLANDFRLLQPKALRPSVTPEYRAALQARSTAAEAAARGVLPADVAKERRERDEARRVGLPCDIDVDEQRRAEGTLSDAELRSLRERRKFDDWLRTELNADNMSDWDAFLRGLVTPTDQVTVAALAGAIFSLALLALLVALTLPGPLAPLWAIVTFCAPLALFSASALIAKWFGALLWTSDMTLLLVVAITVRDSFSQST